jgi:hypothetical protein
MCSKNDLSSGCSESFSVNNVDTNYNFKFKQSTTTLIAGKHGCGKTTFIINKIYRDICKTMDNLYVFTVGESNKVLYKQITNKIFEVDDFTYIYSSIIKNKQNNKNIQNLFIFDDICLELNKHKKILRELIFNASSHNITVIMGFQQVPRLDFAAKDQIDYYAMSNDYSNCYNNSKLKSLYDSYFSIFPTLESFETFYSSLHLHDFIVLNKTVATKNLSEIVSIQKAELFNTHSKILVDITQQFEEIKNESISNEQKLILEELNETIDKLINLRCKLKRIITN